MVKPHIDARNLTEIAHEQNKYPMNIFNTMMLIIMMLLLLNQASTFPLLPPLNLVHTFIIYLFIHFVILYSKDLEVWTMT